MYVVKLLCGHSHQFEGWFTSEADYCHQTDQGLLACPVCGGHDLSAALSVAELAVAEEDVDTGVVIDEAVLRDKLQHFFDSMLDALESDTELDSQPVLVASPQTLTAWGILADRGQGFRVLRGQDQRFSFAETDDNRVAVFNQSKRNVH